MIIPAVSPMGVHPASGPGLTRIQGHAALLAGIVTMAPSPPPPYAILSAVITARAQGTASMLTAISQNQQQLAIRIINTANLPAALGNPVTHEEVIL